MSIHVDITGPFSNHPRPTKLDSIPPVIVMGMHRSGTTLVTQLLQEAGLFMGSTLGRNRESRFFMELNDWILTRCGATWDRPNSIDVLEAYPEACAMLTSQLKRSLRAPMARGFLGTLQWARYRKEWLPFDWGWKDPRNTFTLPLWLELFPDAAVINVERHGIDVALSLQERVAKRVQRSIVNPDASSTWRLTSAGKLSAANGGLACLDLQEGIRLWSAYSLRARRHCSELGNRALTIRFERLLTNPEESIDELLAFLGTACSKEHRTRMANRLDRSKAMAWKSSNDPETRRLAAEFQQTLAALEY